MQIVLHSRQCRIDQALRLGRYLVDLKTARGRLERFLARVEKEWRPVVDHIEDRIKGIIRQLVIAETTSAFSKGWFTARHAERDKLIALKRTMENRIFRPIERNLIDVELEIEKVEKEVLLAAMWPEASPPRNR